MTTLQQTYKPVDYIREISNAAAQRGMRVIDSVIKNIKFQIFETVHIGKFQIELNINDLINHEKSLNNSNIDNKTALEEIKMHFEKLGYTITNNHNQKSILSWYDYDSKLTDDPFFIEKKAIDAHAITSSLSTVYQDETKSIAFHIEFAAQYGRQEIEYCHADLDYRYKKYKFSPYVDKKYLFDYITSELKHMGYEIIQDRNKVIISWA